MTCCHTHHHPGSEVGPGAETRCVLSVELGEVTCWPRAALTPCLVYWLSKLPRSDPVGLYLSKGWPPNHSPDTAQPSQVRWEWGTFSLQRAPCAGCRDVEASLAGEGQCPPGPAWLCRIIILSKVSWSRWVRGSGPELVRFLDLLRCPWITKAWRAHAQA